jgi:hypothetical protein
MVCKFIAAGSGLSVSQKRSKFSWLGLLPIRQLAAGQNACSRPANMQQVSGYCFSAAPPAVTSKS